MEEKKLCGAEKQYTSIEGQGRVEQKKECTAEWKNKC